MSTLKQRLTVMLFIATFSGYSTVFAETTEPTHENSHHAENSLDWSGLYQGFLPCDDCKGIKTTLALNKNNSYLLITQYVGKSDREIVEKGKFTWGDVDNTIVLTPRNSEQTRHYLVGENNLIQLDSKGNRITGDEANRYTLRRNEISQPKEQSSHH
ncbi:hypothetical protein BCS42_01545 [Crenothrix sp. D3]|jgi:uncharacterized lipoprotein NlpE involved in copper resistance|nr:hypothetical protein BCS42_01545 [Crenothrix sp. D3]